MPEQFKNDDANYERWIKSRPDGYVYNDFGGTDPAYKKLHKAKCRALWIGPPDCKRTSVRKICSSDLGELLTWLKENKGVERQGYSPCPVCAPLADSVSLPFRQTSYGDAQAQKETPTSGGPAASLVLARRLIEIYTQHKLPRYLKTFYEPLGYTKGRVEDDPNLLYSIVLLAAYDRRPYTVAAGGWENIWGTLGGDNSLRALLDTEGLMTLETVNGLSLEDIERHLGSKRFCGYRIDSDGANTVYAKTIKDIAHLITVDGLLVLMTHAQSADNVEQIFRLLDRVHGIGKTIASKIIMYTLREIGVGHIWPGHLWLSVEPILKEYHNARIARELEDNLGEGFIREVSEHLRVLGDPCAIDALYYVDRDEPQLRQQVLQLPHSR